MKWTDRHMKVLAAMPTTEPGATLRELMASVSLGKKPVANAADDLWRWRFATRDRRQVALRYLRAPGGIDQIRAAMATIDPRHEISTAEYNDLCRPDLYKEVPARRWQSLVDRSLVERRPNTTGYRVTPAGDAAQQRYREDVRGPLPAPDLEYRGRTFWRAFHDREIWMRVEFWWTEIDPRTAEFEQQFDVRSLPAAAALSRDPHHEQSRDIIRHAVDEGLELIAVSNAWYRIQREQDGLTRAAATADFELRRRALRMLDLEGGEEPF